MPIRYNNFASGTCTYDLNNPITLIYKSRVLNVNLVILLEEVYGFKDDFVDIMVNKVEL